MLIPVALLGSILLGLASIDQLGGAESTSDRQPPPVQFDGSSQVKDPFSQLFAGAPARPLMRVDLALPVLTEEKSKPQVRCGIIVVPAPADVDPGIVVRPPEGNVDFQIRVITGEPCKN